MAAKKSTTDRTVTVVLYDGDYGFAMNVFKNLYLGPGEPGPGDEWKCPAGPVGKSGIEDHAAHDQVHGESPDDPTARG